MRDLWIDMCRHLAQQPADFYSGARKILRNVHWTFPRILADPALTLDDCGFRIAKQRMLERNYLNKESIDAAVKLWERLLSRDKYGSAGFSCYNHLVKGSGLRDPWQLSSKVTGVAPRPGGTMGGRRSKDDKTPKAKVSRASVMGPCIQAVTLTYLPKGACSIDIFYRTTELFKKFPADLVFLRDVLLPPFDLERTPVESLNMHFANVTCHPMYFVTLIPSLKDPIAILETLRKKDKHFFDWTVKWTARYIVPEYFRGIEKFAQAMRVRKDALERIDKATMRPLTSYLKKHHPGYRNEYTPPDEEEEE